MTAKRTMTFERLILSALLLAVFFALPVSMAEAHSTQNRNVRPRSTPRPPPTPPRPMRYLESSSAPAPASAPTSLTHPGSAELERDGDFDGAMDDQEQSDYVRGGAAPAPQVVAQTPTTGTVVKAQPMYSGGANSRQIGTVRPGDLFTIIQDHTHYTWVRFADGRAGYIRRNEVKEVVGIRSGGRLEANCSDCHLRGTQQPVVGGNSLNGLAQVAGHLAHPPPPRRQGDLGPAPVTRAPTAGDEIMNVASGRAERLMIEAKKQALVCRQPASFLRRRYGSRPICGNRSKGMCYRAVKDALTAAGITRSNLPGESAKDAHKKGYLRQAGMRDIMANLKSRHGNDLQAVARNAPPGAVLVYDGGSHGHGHIEIKAGQNQYCSDFCSTRPVSTYLRRRLIGVYVP
jgi:hypothetical protein